MPYPANRVDRDYDLRTARGRNGARCPASRLSPEWSGGHGGSARRASDRGGQSFRGRSIYPTPSDRQRRISGRRGRRFGDPGGPSGAPPPPHACSPFRPRRCALGPDRDRPGPGRTETAGSGSDSGRPAAASSPSPPTRVGGVPSLALIGALVAITAVGAFTAAAGPRPTASDATGERRRDPGDRGPDRDRRPRCREPPGPVLRDHEGPAARQP